MESNKSGLHCYFRPQFVLKPHQLFHHQQEKEWRICHIVLCLMNNTQICALSMEIDISAVLTSLNMSKKKKKSYLYAEMHTPVSASTCIMHSSSPTRTAQKYRTSRSHLHKHSEHEGLISGEKNIYCQILWESVPSVHVTFSFDPISNPTWEKLPESSEGFFFSGSRSPAVGALSAHRRLKIHLKIIHGGESR